MLIIFVVLALEVHAVEQGRHALVRRHELQDASMQQDDADPVSQAAKAASKGAAWDSLPYSSFAGKKDSKVHPEDDKSAEDGHYDAKVPVHAMSMEVSPTGHLQTRPVSPEASEVPANAKPSAPAPVARDGPSGAPGAAPQAPAVSEEKWMQGPLGGTAFPLGEAKSEAASASISPGKLGADAPTTALFSVEPRGVSAEALAVAKAAQEAALRTGASIQVSPGNVTVPPKEQEKAVLGIQKGTPPSLVEAAQAPVMPATPVMSAVPATPVVADPSAAAVPAVAAAAPAVAAAAPAVAATAPAVAGAPAVAVPMAAATTAAATTAPATTAAATTAAVTTAAGTTAGVTTAATAVATTTEEAEPETTEEEKIRVAVGAGAQDEDEKEEESEENEEKNEEEEEEEKGAGKASFVEQHLVLLAAGGVGVVTLLVIGLVCCCRR